MTTPTSSGLDGVVVADTAISEVDGERGRLVIAGFDVERLAASCRFPAAAAKVLAAGGLAGDPADVETALGHAREEAWRRLPDLGDALDAPDGMDALRAALAHLRAVDDDAHDAIAAIGAAPVFAAAWARKHAGSAPVAPDGALDHATDYLRMSVGKMPSPEAARALDMYLVTVIDHGMNASTFTARVVTSTAS